MKKILCALALSASALVHAGETCPQPSSIHPSQFMGQTIYKAEDYQSRWFYEPGVTVTAFIRAEATEEQLQECWYKAKTEQGREIWMSLSPMFLVAPNLDNSNWKHFKNEYHHCEGTHVEDCPLHTGKRMKK